MRNFTSSFTLSVKLNTQIDVYTEQKTIDARTANDLKLLTTPSDQIYSAEPGVHDDDELRALADGQPEDGGRQPKDDEHASEQHH